MNFAHKLSLVILCSCFSMTFLLDKVLIISIPKCGTHLLVKLLNLLNNNNNELENQWISNEIDSETVNKFFSLSEVVYPYVHAPYSISEYQFLVKNKIKAIFIYRDRDQIVSFAYWGRQAYSEKNGWFSMLNFTFDDCISRLIYGKDFYVPWKAINIRHFYGKFLHGSSTGDLYY